MCRQWPARMVSEERHAASASRPRALAPSCRCCWISSLLPSLSRQPAAPGYISRHNAALTYKTLTHHVEPCAAEDRFIEGCSTKREKAYVLEEYLSDLEAQGWFLTGPVTLLWAGERDEETLKNASDVRLAHLYAHAAACRWRRGEEERR